MFDRYAVLPIAMLMTDAITTQLAPDFDDSLFVEWEPFVSEDKEFALKQEEADLKGKVRSPQQVLRDRNADPEDAPWGEFPIGTLAESPYTGDTFEIEPDVEGALGEEPEPEPVDIEPEDEDRTRRRLHRNAHFAPEREFERQLVREKKFVPAMLKAMRSIFRDQERSVLARLAEEDDEPRARAVNVSDIFEPAEWERVFTTRIGTIREAAFREIIAETLTGLGVDTFVFTDQMRQFLATENARLVKHTGVTTQRMIAESLQVSTAAGEGLSQQSARIRAVFTERRKHHARTIERTETLKASQQAQIEGFEVSEVVESKEWNTALDGDVRDSHGGPGGNIPVPIVELREPVILADGEAADAPGIGAGGGSLSAANTINCRCFTTPVLED